MTCRCGKRRFTRFAAERALLEARIARALRRSTTRREQRVYRCPAVPGIWHLTSRGAS